MYFQTSCNDFIAVMEYFNWYHVVVDAVQSLCVCRVVCARSREREREREKELLASASVSMC